MVQIGTITVDGTQVGVVTLAYGYDIDSFTPDLDGYEPQGRASETPQGMPEDVGEGEHHGPGRPRPHHPPHPGASLDDMARRGRDHVGASLADRARHGAHHLNEDRSISRGTETTNQAIEVAARAHNVDPAFMKGVASIESGMNPSSNADNGHKYKGLYQIGPEEWKRFGGGGNIYSASDNAMAAARMFDANRKAFEKHFGRAPTDTEMYLMHQQGLGFYTKGTMTNIAGNLPAKARTPENMTHAGFERYWGNQLARREAQFRHSNNAVSVGDNANPAPSELLKQAKQVAQSGGAAAVYSFMANNGYPKDGNWCGEFAAAVLRSTGGTPPSHPQVASNWRKWGRATTTPRPGDIAVRRGVPTGSTGSHVTIVESYDPKTGTFKAIGGNQREWEENLPASRFDFRTDHQG